MASAQRVAWLFFLLFGMIGSSSVGANEGKFAPPAGKVLFIVGQTKPAIDDYVRNVGIAPGGVMFYTSIQQLEGLDEATEQEGVIHHGQYLIEKYPQSVLQIGLWMVDGLESVAQGGYDRQIDILGKWIQKAARPVFLRIGYEFDLPLNHYDPQAYVRAYRHLVDRFRQKGVTNTAFVWHSYANLPQHPWEDWYPGDEYVDWFAVSVFSKPNVYMQKFAELARQHGKPLMIAESTPKGLGIQYGQASWDAWFKEFFGFIAEQDVKVACYIDGDWEGPVMFRGQGWGDARVWANDVLKKNWVKEISQVKYLQASPDLYKNLGYQ